MEIIDCGQFVTVNDIALFFEEIPMHDWPMKLKLYVGTQCVQITTTAQPFALSACL